MSKEHVRAWVWVGVFFLAAWGLLMPQRAAAHTWWCEANGGTHTCEAPVDIKWIPTGQSPYDPDHPVVGPFFDTAQDAIDYGMPDVLANCGVCTDTAVLSDTWGASIIEKKIWPDVFDDNVPAYLILQAYWVPVPGNTYNGIYVPTGRPSRFYCGDAGFGTLADDYVPYYYDFSCTQYPTPLSSDYVKYPICRAGLRPITDYDGAGGFDWENGTPNPGYDRFECVEPDDYNLTDGSCCDSASAEGVSIGGNPVQLSTGAKLDHVVDYTNASPFPITWERYYHSKKQVWSFGYQQSLFVFLSGAGFDQATLTRPDGTLIRFHRAATTHDPWTLNMGSNQSVRATFTEVLDSLGTSVDHYEYRTLSDTTETYSPDGKLQSVADRYGRKLTMTYPTTGSQVGLLSRIDDDAGRYLELTYGATDTYGRRYVESVTDGDKIISYAFTTGVGLAMDLPVYGFLTDVEQADGTLVSYMYGTYSEWGSVDYNFQRLTGIVDEDGNPYASYQYDYFGRVIEEHHGTSAQPFTYAYDTSAWSPLSSFTTMSWDGGSTTFDAGAVYSGLAKNSGSDERCAYCSGPEANAITYDAYGNPTAETDFNGVVTHRTYDTDRALKLTETEDVGGPLERTTTWTWNPDFRLPATREEPIETDAGAGTRTTTWAYDTNGTLLSETVAPDTGETARARFWTYNAQAEPLTATDARSHTTTYTYDTAFNLTSVEDPLAHTTTYGNYTLQGQAGTITDPNGLQTVITYDDRQRPTEIKRGTSGTHWETTTIAYAAIGKVHRIDLPNGFWAEYVYDDAHRLVEIDTALGRQLYTLDAMGHRTGTTTKDSGGTTLVSATATYGALGDLATSLDANSEETGYSYSDAGQLTGTLDPLTHTATRSYDALRRLHILTNENGEQATLAYDPSDGLVEVNDALGHTTTTTATGSARWCKSTARTRARRRSPGTPTATHWSPRTRAALRQPGPTMPWTG